MPIYEYECSHCGRITEAVQKFSDPPLTECRHCQGGKVSKIISRSTFHLKGSGWYVTDYSGKSQNASGSSKTAEKDSPTKSESKSKGDAGAASQKAE